MRKEVIGTATLYHADAVEVLPTLARADAAITDPPYNVGKLYGEHDDRMEPDAYCDWLAAIWRGLPTDTLIYTPGFRHLWDSPRIIAAAGFQLCQQVLAWHKKEYAGDKWGGGPAMCWEPVLWAHKGEKVFNRKFGAWGRDFLVVNATHGNPYAALHPCPKPIEVFRWLVGMFTTESVLDPFMGSGTSGEAAIFLGRSYVGIEREERFFNVACERIERAQRQGRLIA